MKRGVEVVLFITSSNELYFDHFSQIISGRSCELFPGCSGQSLPKVVQDGELVNPLQGHGCPRFADAHGK